MQSNIHKSKKDEIDFYPAKVEKKVRFYAK